MCFPIKKVLGAAPFLVLLTVSLGSYIYFGSAEFLSCVLMPTRCIDPEDIPGVMAFVPDIAVYCSSTAYEWETIRLRIRVRRHKDNPLQFRVEAPDQIGVQGAKEREVREAENWFLLPKEQGEFVVVVRGLGQARNFSYEHKLSVRRFDHLPRRWFVLLTTVAGVVGFIGAVKALSPGSKTKPTVRR
jgi:hypothetical protein